jgi:hypothetical protein
VLCMAAAANQVLHSAGAKVSPSPLPGPAAEHTTMPAAPPLRLLLCRWRPLRVVGARSHYAAPKQAAVGAQEADATVAAQPKVRVWHCACVSDAANGVAPA